MSALTSVILVTTLARMDVDELGGQAAVNVVIDVASDIVRGHLGQDLSAATDTEIAVPGTENDQLLLPERPITSVSVVSIGGEAIADFSHTSTHLVRAGGWGKTTVDVTYSHGYDDPPNAVAAVVAQLAVRALTQTDNAKQETYGAASLTIENTTLFSLDDAMKSQLDDFAAANLGTIRADDAYTIRLTL